METLSPGGQTQLTGNQYSYRGCINKCIYCLSEAPGRFTKREHVIPQSFGTFGDRTPVLRCVCDDCNEVLGRELDQPFARESLEGIIRYRHGLFSSESRQLKSIRVTLPKTPDMGEFGGAVVSIDGKTGKITPPLPQVHFKRTDGQGTEIFLLEELTDLDWRTRGLSDKGIVIMSGAEADRARLIEALEKIGIKFRETSQLAKPVPVDAETQSILVNITGTVDTLRKRALVKILFNFAAFYLGEDEIRKPKWNHARAFVRYNGQSVLGRAGTEPFWGQESEKVRLKSKGYNLRVENDPQGVIGKIQLFNQFMYTFILCEKYSIEEDQEKAVRFEPGQPPSIGIKMVRPMVPGVFGNRSSTGGA